MSAASEIKRNKNTFLLESPAILPVIDSHFSTTARSVQDETKLTSAPKWSLASAGVPLRADAILEHPQRKHGRVQSQLIILSAKNLLGTEKIAKPAPNKNGATSAKVDKVGKSATNLNSKRISESDNVTVLLSYAAVTAQTVVIPSVAELERSKIMVPKPNFQKLESRKAKRSREQSDADRSSKDVSKVDPVHV